MTNDNIGLIGFIDCADRKEWLKKRQKTIGASEAAAVIGVSKYMSNQDLWRNKTATDENVSEITNPQIEYGNNAEPLLRQLYALKHPDIAVVYHPFRIYVNSTYPFMSCTLDGELFPPYGVRTKGIWECKTALINSNLAYKEWEGEHIPQQYYCQVLHQLAVMDGYDFVVVNAELRFPDGKAEIIERRIDRADVKEDIDFVIHEEKKFWKYVTDGKEPPMSFTL